MNARKSGRFGTILVGVAVALMAFSGTANAATNTISVPNDFVQSLSDTRATGHYEVVGTGLHIWTEGSTGSDKVAEYVATSTPLSKATDTALNYTATRGIIPPGAQLVVDFDADGTTDGILVGEPAYYGDDWWVSDGAEQFVKDDAPSHQGGSGSGNHGTLQQWVAAFPKATVKAFGFSLGSGVYGDGVLNSITFAGNTYTFTASFVNKDQCKDGGWATSTNPVFKNQGDCVSHFAAGK